LQWAGVLAVGLIVAGVIVALWLRKPTTSTPTDRYPPQVQSSPNSDRIHALVLPLLNDPDWTDSRVAVVNASLLEEGSRQIADRQQTEWFQRFAAEVRQRVKKQRALGAHPLEPENSALAALAVTIGLDLNALDEPLHPPPRGESSVVHPKPSPER
jgi:hypothetical protein